MIQKPSQTSDIEKTAKEAAVSQESPDEACLKRFFSCIQKFGYRMFRSVKLHSQKQRRLEELRRRDEKNNIESEPPLDEVIDLRCVWAVEFYTPSQLSGLLSGFEELGWDKDEFARLNKNPAHWIQHRRESAHGGGVFNLGVIQRTGDKKSFFPPALRAPLPIGVEYARAMMHSLTSSLACIVICFVLDDTQNRRYEQALRRTRQTYMMPFSGHGYHIMDPRQQKITSIKTLRTGIRELAAGWFRDHFPGLFTSGILAGEYPTCEFLTLRNTLPFPPLGTQSGQKTEWLHILGVDSNYDVWQAEEPAGLKFALPRFRNKHHVTIAAREDDFSDEIMHGYREKSRESITHYVDQFVNSLLSRWALVGVLSSFERYLNNARDSAAFNAKHRSKPIQLLENLTSHIAQSIDISAASAELQQFAEHRNLFNHDIHPFFSCDSTLYQDDEIILGEILRQQVMGRAKRLHNIDRSIRDILIQYGTILGTRENIKLQKHIAFLTWVVVVLAVVTITLTIVTTIAPITIKNLPLPP